MAVTRLGLYGGPRPPYGSFAGKVENVDTGDPIPPPTGGSGIVRHRDLQAFRDRFTTEYTRARIIQEDEEILSLLIALLAAGIL